MFIIFGTKGRSVKKDNGRFYCPHCEGERNYTQYRLSNYFTLFFIPIFPFNTIANYVQCDTCQGQFNLEVLEISADQILLRRIYADAVAGMPMQMISKKLLNQGLNQFEADAAVQQVANQAAQKSCASCQMTFLADANLQSCTACGGQLL
ncbi:MAG: zinc-ribbon domain-containing protein [Saezia sp.]